MKYSSQKTQIAEQIVNCISDLQDHYVRSLKQLTSEWDSQQTQMYLLNCDTEIQTILSSHYLVPDDKALAYGLSFGVLVIKNEINRNYKLKFGDQLDLTTKQSMYNELNECVIKFVLHGLGDFDDS